MYKQYEYNTGTDRDALQQLCDHTQTLNSAWKKLARRKVKIAKDLPLSFPLEREASCLL